MYLQFYQLRSNPFHSTPDPDLFFPSTQHTTLLEALRSSVAKGESLVVLTGEAGLGKTLLLRTFLARLDEQKICAILLHQTSHLTFNSLLCQLLQTFGVKIESRDTATLLSQVRSELIKERILRRKVLLILDDAHNLPQGTLRQLPSLAYLEQPAEQLLQIILSGQPALEEASQMCLNALSDSSHFALTPLPLHESMAYLRARLQHVAMNDEAIFTDEALETLAIRARGIPGALHQLAQGVLVAGCITQRKPLTEEDVRQLLTSTPIHSLAARQSWQLSRRTLALLGGSIAGIGLCAILLHFGTPSVPWQQPATTSLESVEPLQPASGTPGSQENRLQPTALPQPQVFAEAPVNNPFEHAPATPAPVTRDTVLFVTTIPFLQEPVVVNLSELSASKPAAATQLPANAAELPQAPKKFPLKRLVEPGDTLWSLAVEVYGPAASNMMSRIKAANPQVRNVERIVVGTVLQFPDPKALPVAPPKPAGAPARPALVANAPAPVQTSQNTRETESPAPPEPEAPRKRGFFEFLRKAFPRHEQGAENPAAFPFRDAPVDRPSQ